MIELLRGEQMSKNTIGEKISELRKQSGLSQKELADKLCVSNKTVSKWECGNGEPDIGMLKKLSEIFGISIDYLLDNEMVEHEDVTEQIQPETSTTVVSNTKPNRKYLISIIVFAATAIIIIFLACFFLIPRSPRIMGNTGYVIDEEHSSIYCTVDNDITVYSIDGFDVPMLNSWQLYRDTSLGILISDRTVNLQAGDNVFYVVVKNYAGQSKVYTLTIRRKPLYVVTFDTNGGENILPKTIMEGEYLDVFTPTRDGYIFSGWDYEFNQPILKNTTIIANWIAKELSITYHSNNGNTETETQEVIYDSHISLRDDKTFSMIGYTLSAWNTKADGTGDKYLTGQDFVNYNISTDIELYAQWTIYKYNLSANLNFVNAGTITGTGDFDYNSTHTLTAHTNDGYSWVGWYDSNNELVTTNTQLEVTIQDNDISYYAKWNKNSYTVSLDVNGGNELSRNDQTLIFDSPFSLPVPTRTEATFAGWYVGDVQYTDSFGISVIDWNIADNATVYAHWNINKYTVNVTSNNEKGGLISGVGEKEYGSTVTLTANENTGYSFVGWYQGNDLLSDDLVFEFPMPNHQLNYIAKWQANHYSIILNANNGDRNEIKDVIFDSSFTFDVPEKVGYTFVGWFNINAQLTDELGAGLNVWNIADNIEVTAKWDVITYTVSYSLNGGNVLSNAESYTIEDLDIIITNPIRKGYTFVGWISTDSHTPNKSLVISAGSYGNKVFAAVWEQGVEFVAIGTVDQFKNISQNLAGYYYLTSDIDFENIAIETLGDENNPFTGILDGKGYKLSNITITGGLINTNNGLIQNLYLENITSSSCSLAKSNNGTIRSCKFLATVNGRQVGGITQTNNGVIEYCQVFGSVSALAGNRLYFDAGESGGITHKNTGEINYCIVYADIYTYGSSSSAYASGIAHTSLGGIIKNCIVIGSVKAQIGTSILGEDKPSANVARICFTQQGYDDITCYCLDTAEFVCIGNYGSSNKRDITNKWTDKMLQDKSLIGFKEYKDEYDALIFNENVWVFSENEYPKLYWDKEKNRSYGVKV